MNEKLAAVWTFLLDHFKVTLLLVFFTLIWGTVAYNTIPRETEPTIEIPMATVTTIWPGASAMDVEKLVTDKLEKQIKTLENLKKYESFSRSGVSMVVVEFEVDSSKDTNIQRLREKINDAEKDLPDTVLDSPEVSEVSVSDVPVLSLVISGDYSWSELKQFSKVLEDELEGIQKVKEIDVKGAPTDQVHILVDPIRSQAKQVGINEILSVIRASHQDMPMGAVAIDGQKIEVTVRSEMEKPSEFANLPIKVVDGSIVKLSDVATVRREFEKFDVETYFSTEKQESQPAVLINVIKSASRGNVLTMVGNVLSRIEELKQQGSLPSNLTASVTYNRADRINWDLRTLAKSGIETLILVMLVMFIATSWRESLIAAFAIPLSLLISIVFLQMMGQTFNGVLLFSLILGIGMLVDNAIVVVTSISECFNLKKMSLAESALHTIDVYRWPLLGGTLTMIFAFVPMLFFISGVAGQYISVIPITITIALSASIFVALWLLPPLTIRFFRIFPPAALRESPMLKKMQDWYGKTMTPIFSSPKKVFSTLGIGFALFIAASSLVVTGLVPIEVFPSTDATYFTAEFKLPEGSSLEETRQLVEPISGELRKYFKPQKNKDVWLSTFVFTVGESQNQNETNLPKENILGLTVNLTEKGTQRKTGSYDIIPLMQKDIEEILPKYVESTFTETKKGPTTGKPVQVRISGDDLVHLEKMADQLKEDLQKIPGTVDVTDSRDERVSQMTWKFDRDLLSKFGFTPAQVLESLRASVNGTTAVKLTEGDEEIDVNVRVDWKGDAKWDDPDSLDFLNQIFLKTPSGQFVSLQQVASPEISSELSGISHRNSKRIITVESNLEQGIPASKIKGKIDEAIKKLPREQGEIIEFGGDTEEGNRLMEESAQSFLVALILILVVLVLEFNSFYQSFVILMKIPFCLIAVFIGFWISGFTITFPTMIGIVSLTGIVINTAIVLIDQVNRNQEEGCDRVTSYIEAGKQRLQPILLTSITTVVGMIPLSLSDEFWGGLGFAIVYGMLLSAPITLLLVPCLLEAGSLVEECFERIGKRIKAVFVSERR